MRPKMRTASITLRLLPAEFRAFHRAASRARANLSEWLRRLAWREIDGVASVAKETLRRTGS